MFDNLEVANIDILDHQESGCAHDRWHDLSVHPGSDFDGTPFLVGKAHSFHHRDGEVLVVTTFAMEDPEIRPVMPEARTATLAGPPRI